MHIKYVLICAGLMFKFMAFNGLSYCSYNAEDRQKVK